MYKKSIYVGIIIIVIAVLISTQSKTDTTKIGVILPLTGQYASLGESSKNAIELAQAELQTKNLEFIFEDDAYDAKKAITAYQKLKSLNDIQAVIVLSAPSIQSLKPLTDKDNIPLLGLGGTNVYERDSVYQLMPSGNEIFPTLGRIYSSKYKHITVARANATLFENNAKAFIGGLGKETRYTDVIANSGTDYLTEVAKIVNSNTEAVTVFFPQEEAVKFLKALRVQDKNKRIHIVCDFGTQIAPKVYADAIGEDRLEGCISTNMADTMTSHFKNAYKEKFNKEPMVVSDYAYDAVGMIQDLQNKKDWNVVLSDPNYSYDGYASGKIQFSPDGTRLDMEPGVFVYKGGEFVLYK